MATQHRNTARRPSHRRASSLSSLTELQLDAYLQTRDTLRRLRALTALIGHVKQHGSPPSTPGSPV